MILKYLVVGAIAYFIYRFWDTSQKKINQSKNDQEPDQYADYEEIE